MHIKYRYLIVLDIILVVMAIAFFLIPSLINKALYHPTPGFDEELLNEYELEEQWIPITRDQDMHAVYKVQSKDYVILFLHGNAGNITINEPNIKYLVDAGASFLMIDYPGYGLSPGEVSEQNLYQAASKAYRYLTESKGWELNQVIINGQSLGGAVAIDLASKVPSRSVIVESSFPSLAHIAEHHYPWIPFPKLWLKQYNSISKIKNIKSPLLFIHGAKDELLPVAFTEQLYEAANESKYKIILPDLGHNDVFSYENEDYVQRINTFISTSVLPD